MVLMPSSPPWRPLLKSVVAFTPLAGAVAFPMVVPLLMVRIGVAAGVMAAVLVGTIWIVLMLRTAEMPGHD